MYGCCPLPPLFQFIAVGSDLKLMMDGAAELVRGTNPDRALGEIAKY